MKSMTGFAYDSVKLDNLTINCNIASYNSRFVDIKMHLPELLYPFQMDIYDKIKEKIGRGRIEINININMEDYHESPLFLKRIEKQIKRLRKIKNKFKLSGDISISELNELKEINIEVSDLQTNWNKFESFFDKLLDELIRIRIREGNIIKGDLREKSEKFKDILTYITDKTEEVTEEQKDKIMEDIKKLNDLDIHISRDDINLFAFKGDIEEELVRLQSHINYFGELIEDEAPVGRRLKFLLQEMAREVNTIGSKAQSANIVHRVIDLKELLDEMREQVENIE